MSDVYISCCRCGSELKVFGEGPELDFQAVPCEKCKDDTWLAGYNNGHRDGYTLGYKDRTIEET